MKSKQYPMVIPVIELGINTLPLDSKVKRFAFEIEKKAAERGYLKTPDGWFVPLNDLQLRTEDVVEFFSHEILHFHEFDIAGGFIIHVSPKLLLDIPFDSSFRFGMDLAEAIKNIGPGMNQNIAVGNQEYWNISVDSISSELIILRKGKTDPVVRIPFNPLKIQFQEAKTLLIDFSSKLEFLFRQNKDLHITSEEIKFVFGLDKTGE